jgi:hypothetical protein
MDINDDADVIICIKCKHPVFEHFKHEETGFLLCHRIMEVKAGKPFKTCYCNFLNTTNNTVEPNLYKEDEEI